MELHLELPAPDHERQYNEKMDEWEAAGGRIQPGALRRNGADTAKPSCTLFIG